MTHIADYNKFRSEISSRNSVHSPELQEAIERLVELGVLIPFEENNYPALYHGSKDVNLRIDEFQKWWNNANAYNGFYTTDDFDLAHQVYSWEKWKVYEIVPRNGGWYIFNSSKKHNQEELQEISKIFAKFIPSMSEVVHDEFLLPLEAKKKIQEREKIKEKYKDLQWYFNFRDDQELKDFSKQFPNDFDFLSQFNTYIYILSNPWRAISFNGIKMQRTQNALTPFSQRYLEAFMEKLWIIGEVARIHSASANWIIEPIVFFDFSKIQTKEVANLEKEQIKSIFEPFARKIALQAKEDWKPNTKEAQDLQKIISLPYASPSEIIEQAKKISPKMKILLESETGNWEWFTLEEHVETVLNNLEYNFADKIPMNVLSFLRLVFLIHDLWKDKNKGKKYDIGEIHNFLDSIGISSDFKNFIISIITDGTDFAHLHFIKREDNSFTQNVLRDLKKSEAWEAMWSLLYIIVTCDGGAYTNMWVTRRRIKDLWMITHRNAGSLNDTFKKSQDLQERKLKIKFP